MTEHRRRASDRQLFAVRENWYRDAWLLVITGLAVWTLAKAYDIATQLHSNQARNTAALCAVRADLEARVASREAFLISHPHGIPGIPAPTIRSSIRSEQGTVRALRPVACPHHRKRRIRP